MANVRATVFHTLVEKVLREKHAGEIRRLGRGGKRRPDLPAHVTAGGESLRGLVFPAFADGDVYWNPKRLRGRAQELAQEENAAWALIVVPPGSSAKLEPEVKGVRLVTFDALLEAEDLRALLSAEGLV